MARASAGRAGGGRWEEVRAARPAGAGGALGPGGETGAALGPVSRFSVAAGSSEWAVLYEFARYHNGICPRFDREGRLILSPWADTREIALDDAVPVERLSCRVRRSVPGGGAGPLSEPD